MMDTKLREVFPALENVDCGLEELDLPVRAFNFLKRGEVHTLQQLLEYSHSELLLFQSKWKDRDKIIEQINCELRRLSNMDIYSFIRSRDIAAYCREINKTWNTCEMATIISRSNRPMADKHVAWRELIANHPDIPSLPTCQRTNFGSTHKKLEEIMDYEQRVLALFKKPELGAVYRYKVCHDSNSNSYSYTVFTCLEKALSDLKERWERDDVSEFRVEKVYIDDADGGNGVIEVSLDYDGDIYWSFVIGSEAARTAWFPGFDLYESSSAVFDSFYIYIPTPFKCGDILTDSRNVFVHNRLSQDDPERLAKYLSGEMGDGTDMIGWGFFVSDDGVLFGNHTHDLDCFEYYRGKPEGNNRLLHYVSLFLKDKIGLPELLTMQCRIMLEHQLECNFPIQSHGCYIDDSLLAENLNESE
jgi:hypothetical protein